MVSVEQLITLGYIFQENPEATLDGGFIRFLPTEGYVFRLETLCDGTMTATKFELIKDDKCNFWVIQLEGLPEDPITFLTNTQQPFQIFKRVKL